MKILEKNSLNSFKNFTDLIYVGDDISINCLVISYPKPEIVWSMTSEVNGHEKSCILNKECLLKVIGKNQYILEWKIFNATRSDRGNYTCSSWTVENSSERIKDYIIIRVRRHFLWVTPLLLNFGAISLLVVIINFTKTASDDKSCDTALLKPTRNWNQIPEIPKLNSPTISPSFR